MAAVGCFMDVLVGCSTPTLETSGSGTDDQVSDNQTPNGDLTGSQNTNIVPPDVSALVPPDSFADPAPGTETSETAGVTPDNACVQSALKSTAATRPVDIIFVIDNSGSMGEEIAEVESQINTNFANIVEDAGIDYRVFMVSNYGPRHNGSRESTAPPILGELPDGSLVEPLYRGGSDVCITAPLGGAEDADGDGVCDAYPLTPASSPRFQHFPVFISSVNGPCQVLETLKGTTRTLRVRPSPGRTRNEGTGNEKQGNRERRSNNNGNGNANGNSRIVEDLVPMREVLRENAFKIIVFITDDQIYCEFEDITYISEFYTSDLDSKARNVVSDNSELKDTNEWETALQKLAPEHFGATPETRRYSVWSIVGQAAFDPSSQFPGGRPAPPEVPATDEVCGSEAQAPGIGYQELSILTGGYRFPSCEDDYTEMFQLMSQGVISGSNIPCTFEIPTPQSGEDVLLDTVEMTYTSAGVNATKLSRVNDTTACTESSFLITGDSIQLCPQACARIGSDPDAELNTLFGCELDIR